jgi:hypothetical protein
MQNKKREIYYLSSGNWLSSGINFTPIEGTMIKTIGKLKNYFPDDFLILKLLNYEDIQHTTYPVIDCGK